MSLVPTAWMTAPAARNKSALKSPCVSRCRNPAGDAPAPAAAIMYPSCETVEYASTRLMSPSTHAIVAARSAVNAPTQAIRVSTSGTSANRGSVLVTM